MVKLLIVYHKDDKLHGINYNVENSEQMINFRNKLIKYTTDVEVYEFISEDNDILFKDMSDMNDFFDLKSEASHLIVLKNNQWYCRTKGSNTFIQLVFDENKKFDNTEEELYNRLQKVEKELSVLKLQYTKDQKYTWYIMVMFLLIVTFIVVQMFFFK